MAITDLAIFIFLAILVFSGARQGFARSVVQPVALIISFTSCWTIYLQTHNFNAALMIGILGPFILSWLMDLGLNYLKKINPEQQLSTISRLGGISVGLIWGGAMVFIAVALMSLLPFKDLELENVGKDFNRSVSRALIRPVLVKQGLLPSSKAQAPCPSDLCSMDASAATALAASPDIQELTNDPLVQKLLKDPEAMAAMKSQNIGKILTNPVINEMKSNPQFILKMMRLYPKVQEQINASRERQSITAE
ncbi:MAG: CvpA family protein [Candidatus Omnitrophica bacterium]|nr:CvpA family protein [Candidatus Omnitrophota bacterium]